EDLQMANKPIIVYKDLYSNRSLHQGYNYFPMKINTVSLHNIVNDIRHDCVNFGFHSRLDAGKRSRNNSVFVIPEGARYIPGKESANGFDNYVSNSIVYIGKRGRLFTWWRLFRFKRGWL